MGDLDPILLNKHTKSWLNRSHTKAGMLLDVPEPQTHQTQSGVPI